MFIDVILVFLLLTMNIFYTFFWCFYCCLWASKYQLSILITSASMVSVVYVPILVQFSLNIPPRLEGQFLQCCQRTVFRKLLFLFAQIQFFMRFLSFCSNYGRLLENILKIWRNLTLKNLACLIQFQLNKVEATARCPTECVLKTLANTLWRRSKNRLS